MDALALLCNLHADGPATLERLRRAGCDRLAVLENMPVGELERCLGAAPSRAQRFLAEARLLRDRLGSALLEDEESAEPRPPETKRPVIEAVLDAWRTRDEAEAPAVEAAGGGSGEADVLVPRRPEALRGRPLEGAGIPGLAQGAIEALAGAGVRTAEALLEVDALEIAQGSGLPFTQVRHLQFLVRRAGVGPEPASEPASEPATEPATEPESTSDTSQRPVQRDPRGRPIGTGGPFAQP